ncbi:MAG TPA: transcriptional repressor [Candidatus Eisenbergiella merdipullorum]|uniref:Transcriptional repressor n=1 Tax=Candidatus Eisenbergiella merdipullorum TaxID=2838553 RepID=A0A9D2I7F7_9FIRM|nr:transcriptional repressor [Candidatus Eisenbergiella merdipullorum]
MDKKEQIIRKLRENGCRITKQRQILIDIILENDCYSCKEIFYKASQLDDGIGVATVYRMINALEEIGVISRESVYKIEYPEDRSRQEVCEIALDDDTVCRLSERNWKRVVQEGMKQCGYLQDQKIIRIRFLHGL